MKILVACEESQAVCTEMRRLGHEAYSCDIQECSGKHPEWHIKGDVLPLINGRCLFRTMDGEMHEIADRWDMLIAHPPCTYLTTAGAIRLYDKQHRIKDPERFLKGQDAAEFFKTLWAADCSRIVIENPTPMKVFSLPQYTQIIEPFYFGDPWRKRTCLWVKGLPPLMPTNIVEPQALWVGSTCGRRAASVYSRYKLNRKRDPKVRSKTFPGIAKAMAEQWAGPAEDVQHA